MSLNNPVIQKDLKEMFSDTSIDYRKFDHSTVLVTGAYGMLASYLVFMMIYLNEYKGYHINIIANGRSEEKMRKRFGSYIDKDYFVMDLQSVTDPFEIDGDVDYLIHAASPASSQFYGVNPVGVILPNVLGTINTLELARERKIKGYLYFSAGEIYGKVDHAVISETDNGYLDPMNVRSCYGQSKRMGETLCACYAYQYQLPCKVVRLGHTFGPTMNIIDDKRVFAEFVSNAVQGQDIVMKSDGSAKRSFCYITDATRACFKVLLDGTGAYNLSTTDGFMSIRDFAEIVCHAAGGGLKVIMAPREAGEAYLENSNALHPIYCIDKLKALGWKNVVTIEDGLKRVITSFQNGMDRKEETL